MKNFICICGKEFGNKNSLIGHKRKCDLYKKYINDILSYDFLYENLINKNYSANYIATILHNENIRADTIIGRAKKYSIQTKSLLESAKLTHTKNMRQETCLKKYGDTNTFGKYSITYKKRNETVKEKYGVDNVFQLESVKEKSKKTMLKKYGVTHTIYFKNRNNNVGKRSRWHKFVEKALNELNIEYISDEPINELYKYNKSLHRMFNPRPDICLLDKKIVIEINGDAWHANPKKYEPNDIIYRWQGEMKAKDIWEYDKIRKEHIENCGYKVIILWQSYIEKNKREMKEILNKIYKQYK